MKMAEKTHNWRKKYQWPKHRDKMRQSTIDFKVFAEKLLEKEFEKSPITIAPPDDDDPAVA